MASIFVRNGWWYLWYRNADGKTVQKALRTKDKQKAKVAKSKVEFSLSEGLPIFGDAPLFGVYADTYLEWHDSLYPASHARVKGIVNNVLVEEFEDLPLHAVDHARANKLIAKRLKVVGAESVRKEAKVLLAILNHAVAEKAIKENPLRGLKLPKSTADGVPPYYTADQLKQLYEKSSPLRAAMWTFLIHTGCRRTEALNLRLANVHDTHVVIESTNERRTKSGRTRKVPLNTAAREAVKTLKEHSKSEFLFPRITRDSLTRAFNKTVTKAGLPGSVHWCRHTFVTNLMLAGVAPRVVQALSGHASLELVLRYSKVVPDEMLEAATAKLDAH